MSNTTSESIKFSFSARELVLHDIVGRRILASAASQNTHQLFIFLDNGELVELNCDTGKLKTLSNIPADLVVRDGAIQLNASPDNQYCAVTSCVYRVEGYEDSNKGIVVDLASGKVVRRLDAGDYHMAQAPFPVCFFIHQDKTCLIFASDWNKLDIVELCSGNVLTSRNFDYMPEENDEDDIPFTEWSGTLSISPDNRRVASVGWIWHPVGVAFSFDVVEWVANNPWEPERGISKRSYAIWDYFWESPIVWLDERRICIWGVQPEFADAPSDCAAIFDADTEEQLLSIDGPTIDLFEYDEYLFSGTHDSKGLSIWSVKDGSLLHIQNEMEIDRYLRSSKEFVSFEEDGRVVFTKWKADSLPKPP